MSGTITPQAAPNPLQGAGSPAAPQPNVLASAGQGAPKASPMPQGPPSVSDALASVQAANLSPYAVADAMERLNHMTPVLAKLSADPDVSRKDVVRAMADAAGARKVDASMAIQFISGMPENPEQLRPWLQQKYQAGLVNGVALHAHAHQLVGAAGAPGPMPGGPPAAPPVAPQTVPHPLAPRIMPGPGPMPGGLGAPP